MSNNLSFYGINTRNSKPTAQRACSLQGMLHRLLPDENQFTKPYTLMCSYCSHALVQKKERKQFLIHIIHKCVNTECPFYLYNLKKVDKEDFDENYGVKINISCTISIVDFFHMDLNSLPENESSLKFTKHSAHVMFLCLTLRVNLGLSLRKTAQALKDLYGIQISLPLAGC